MKCALCGKKIRNVKRAVKGNVSGKLVFFCSETCKRIAERTEEYVMKVEREVGEEWCGIFTIYLDMLFQGREPKCENCINYVEGRCKGGVEPFECFFRKVKRAKEGGLKPDDIIDVSFDPPSVAIIEVADTQLLLHSFFPFKLKKEWVERIMKEVMMENDYRS